MRHCLPHYIFHSAIICFIYMRLFRISHITNIWYEEYIRRANIYTINKKLKLIFIYNIWGSRILFYTSYVYCLCILLLSYSYYIPKNIYVCIYTTVMWTYDTISLRLMIFFFADALRHPTQPPPPTEATTCVYCWWFYICV